MSGIKYRMPLLFGFLLILSCDKGEYSAEAQLAADDRRIVDYLERTNTDGFQKHPSGLYYQVLRSGSGKPVSENSTVSVEYEGKVLDGAVFDSSNGSAVRIPLGQMIRGWQIGLSLVREGSELRLIIPSPLAFGQRTAGAALPPNAILDYVISVDSVL